MTCPLCLHAHSAGQDVDSRCHSATPAGAETTALLCGPRALISTGPVKQAWPALAQQTWRHYCPISQVREPSLRKLSLCLGLPAEGESGLRSKSCVHPQGHPSFPGSAGQNGNGALTVN